MKRILLAVVFLAAASIGLASAQSQYNFSNVTIYEYEGIRMSPDHPSLLGSVSFTTLNNINGRAINRIRVWPQCVRVEVRTDRLPNATTLNVVNARQSEETREYFAESVTVLVANQTDANIWNNYLSGDLKMAMSGEGALTGVSAYFNGSVQVLKFDAQISSPWANDPPNRRWSHPELFTRPINVVEAPISGVQVQPAENLSGSEVRVKAEWLQSLWLIYDGSNRTSARAGAVIIYASPDRVDGWNERLRQWREQTTPHRVLPQ